MNTWTQSPFRTGVVLQIGAFHPLYGTDDCDGLLYVRFHLEPHHRICSDL